MVEPREEDWLKELQEAWEPYWPLISFAVALLIAAAVLSCCTYLDAV